MIRWFLWVHTNTLRRCMECVSSEFDDLREMHITKLRLGGFFIISIAMRKCKICVWDVLKSIKTDAKVLFKVKLSQFIAQALAIDQSPVPLLIENRNLSLLLTRKRILGIHNNNCQQKHTLSRHAFWWTTTTVFVHDKSRNIRNSQEKDIKTKIPSNTVLRTSTTLYWHDKSQTYRNSQEKDKLQTSTFVSWLDKI